MIDLIFLTKLPKTQLQQDGSIVKYLLKDGVEPIQKSSTLMISFKQYDYRGFIKKSIPQLKYYENDHCEGFRVAIRSMKKFQKAWFRIGKQWLEGDRHFAMVPDNGTWMELCIEQVISKVERSMPIQQRIEQYRESKIRGDEVFKKQRYAQACKIYRACFNNMESELSKLNLQNQVKVKKQSEICRRNYVVCVIKGQIAHEQQKARTIISGLVKKDSTAKNWYLYGKLLMQMKYLTDAKEALKKSYNLQSNQQTKKLIEGIKQNPGKDKQMCKFIIENIEAERIKESKQKKREQKDDWLLEAEKKQEQALAIEQIMKNSLQNSDDWNNDDCNTIGQQKLQNLMKLM